MMYVTCSTLMSLLGCLMNGHIARRKIEVKNGINKGAVFSDVTPHCVLGHVKRKRLFLKEDINVVSHFVANFITESGRNVQRNHSQN
jgi:hypothetical protein